jgi:cellulose biosynthesis protein BcsQ
MKDGEYIDPANCVRLHEKPLSDSNGELWLLPGSLDLAKLEPQITFAHNVTNPKIFPLFDDIAGGFRALFLSTCAHYNIDFCLLDMGPSIGELNKSLFWASDYFMIPCSPDSYCKTTMKTMEVTLPLWADQQQRLASVTQEMTMPLNPDPPKFLGILLGLFQTAGKNKAPIKDSAHWMRIIKQTVSDELVPALTRCDMMHDYAPEEYTLAEIPHFLSLMPIAQRSYAPIYDIPMHGFTNHDDDGNEVPMPKTEIARHTERGKFFYQKYEELADLLVSMFNAEDNMDAENASPSA